MYTSILRVFLRAFPIVYIVFIWLQSSYFNPETVAGLSDTLNKAVVLIIGVSLEFAHLFEFGLLYLFIFLAFLSFGKIGKWQNRLAITVALLYSLVDEIHQIYVPFRSFSLDDLLKDAIGIFFIWWLIRNNYFTKKDSRFGELLRKVAQLPNKDKNEVSL
ncbi:VanZ family protein [Bacillus sp. 1NLA3E]|uniref:VanZ family protein n=1 Tax=Bacillus sp. 1NLA3E TaxID=666686 RepID=UPI000247E734|nr:VanZ family protein [Bacillus sp. 1NLA3E]